jgi:hypothetical protein
MLIIDGSLPTVSIWRMYNDTVEDYKFNLYNKKFIKENRLDFISDQAKKRIIDEYIDNVFESEYKDQLFDLEIKGINQKYSLKSYFRRYNK